jgi:site-specific DNA-cytosine methylase
MGRDDGAKTVVPGTREQGIERIGNSVPPLLMRAVATHLRDHLLKPNQVAA